MDLERMEFKASVGRMRRSSSIASRDDDQLENRVGQLKRSDTFIKKPNKSRDSNKRDGKRRSKKERDHHLDPEHSDIGVLEVENSTIDSNGGLVPLKFYQEMEEKYSLALKEKDLLIHSLRVDVQSAEDENATYKAKLLDLKEKFKSATDEIISAEKYHQKLSEKYKVLQEQHEAVKLKEISANNQVAELSSRISDLEDLLNKQENSPDNELEKCLKTVEAKEREIEELENKLQNSSDHISHSDTSEVFIYQKKLFEKNEIIKDLENKLQEAVSEMEESSRTLLVLKSERSQADSVTMLMNSSQNEEYLSKTEEKYLKKQLESLNHKLALATEKIRRYEQNEFGLPEAVVEIENLKKQLFIRDKNIAQLVSKINSMSATPENFLFDRQELGQYPYKSRGKKIKRRNFNFLLDKFMSFGNIYFRKKLPELILKEDLLNKILKWGKIKKKFHQLSKKYQNDSTIKKITEGILEDETGIAITNRHLDQQENDADKQISNKELPMDLGTNEVEHSKDDDRIKVRVEELIAENDYLRKGMHEILDSIRMQDASSDVKVESKSLEHLLNALDQRHVSGWYHPAMRLEAELKCTDGVNAALREQIHSIRLEEKKAKEELFSAISRLNSLESDFTNCISANLPKHIGTTSSDIIDIANCFKQILNDFHEDNATQDWQTKLRKNFQRLFDKLIVLHGFLKHFCQNHVDEKTSWEMEKEELIAALDKLKTEKETSSLVGGDVIMADKEISIKSDEREEMKRKCEALENLIDNLKSEKEALMENIKELKISVIEHEKTLSEQNKTENQQITTLRKQLADSVPRSHLEETTKQLNEVIMKYQVILQEGLPDAKMKELISVLKEQIISCEDMINKQKEYITKLGYGSIELEKEFVINKSKLEIKEHELMKELGNKFTAETRTASAFNLVIDELSSKAIDHISKENFMVADSMEKSAQIREAERSAMEKCSHDEEIEVQQNIIKDLIEQLAKAEFELNEKDFELKELQEVMSLHTNCQLGKKCSLNILNDDTPPYFSKEPFLREFGSVYKVSLNALNVMLNQKEGILSRYKKLVTETREAHAKSLADLNVKENFIYPEKLASNDDTSIGELKNYGLQIEQFSQTSSPTEVPQCANKFEEMQNEIILLQRKCDYLTVQLNVWESEAHRLKSLADRKQVEMEELLNRLELQQKSWFSGPCNSTNNYVVNEVVAELKELLIDSVKKEQVSSEKEVTTNTQFPNKIHVDVGINTEFFQFGLDIENGDLKEAKKRRQRQNVFAISRADAEVIHQELESISNLIEKAESDEKNSEKAISEPKTNLSSRMKGGSKRKSLRITSPTDVEKQKNDVKVLEEQLRNCQIQLETVKKDAELHIKRDVELVRWRENKKWQQTVEKLQERLKTEKNSSDGLKKQNQSLKDAVVRLQREKTILEGKTRNTVASEELERTWIQGSEKRNEVLQKRISTLERTICDLEALNISQKNKLDKYESEIKNLCKERAMSKDNYKHEEEDGNALNDKDIIFEIEMLKEERENLLKDNSKAFGKINGLEEEIINLKEKNLTLEKNVLVLQGKEETSSMIHNELNALRVELARKTKLLNDVKRVLIRVREKTELRKAATHADE